MLEGLAYHVVDEVAIVRLHGKRSRVVAARAVHRRSSGYIRAVRATRRAARFAPVKAGLAVGRSAGVVALDIACRNFVRAAFVIKYAPFRTRRTGAFVRIADRGHAASVAVAPVRITTVRSKGGVVLVVRYAAGAARAHS